MDACFAHDGHGSCGGIKDKEGKWNTKAHKNRIVYLSENELHVISKVFENSDKWDSVKLISIHNNDIIDILEKFANFTSYVKDCQYIIGDGLRENTAVEKGLMERHTMYPIYDDYEMIYSGPHFFVNNPYYKNPREKCILNSDYDIVDLETIPENFTPRTNYKPLIKEVDYKKLVKGFPIGRDANDEIIYDYWIDYYKLAFSAMVGPTSERTLSGAILPPKSSHVHAVISISFKDSCHLIEFTGLCSSLVYDFYMKIIGASSIIPSRLLSFPLGISEKYKNALFSRTLRLNCLSNRYSKLWEDTWVENYKKEEWSIKDIRLSPWSILTKEWNKNTPLRNYFERRMALIEIDVISALALNLSLEELIMMYEIQFPVLQQYENDTWYDRNGRIVFTCSKGLVGVGVDRPTWNTIRDMKEGETYTHTLTSELYAGQQISYEAPFDRCDRISDYRTAWAHFEKRFNNNLK